jgi:hypothetical protein
VVELLQPVPCLHITGLPFIPANITADAAFSESATTRPATGFLSARTLAKAGTARRRPLLPPFGGVLA